MESYGTNLIKITVIGCGISMVSLIVGEYLQYKRARNSEKSRATLLKFLFSTSFIVLVGLFLLSVFGKIFFI